MQQNVIPKWGGACRCNIWPASDQIHGSTSRPPPRRLANQRGNAHENHQTRLKYLGASIFAVIWFALGLVIGHMNNRGGGNEVGPRRPYWDPARTVPFREFVHEVNAWLTVTSARMTPQAQAATMQRGLGGLARRFAMRIPPDIITSE